MAVFDLGISQGERKECYVGNVRMNRYGIFNGLERPRRIDEKHNLTLLGYDPPTSSPWGHALANIGDMTPDAWYSYRYIFMSNRYLRPVPVDDATRDYTRSNPSPVSDPILLGAADRACSVSMYGTTRDDITHLGLYRSMASAHSSEAVAGPWFLTEALLNSTNPGAVVSVIDVNADAELGQLLELDNFPPNAYAYAEEVDDFVFAGGRVVVGEGLTCTVTADSSVVTLDTAARRFYDGIRGWYFTVVGDASGGFDGIGHYFASYVDDTHLRLEDDFGEVTTYNGAMAGSNREVQCFLKGSLLRWCKEGEPESWPLERAVRMQGDIIGIGRIPNQPLLVVITNKPEMKVFDVTIIASPKFKQPFLLSNEFVAHHWSLHPVEGLLRGIDARRGCVWETDGAAVRDLTRGILSEIWTYLSMQPGKQANWHSVYDPHQKIFAAFVTLTTSARMVDFALIQNLRTNRWFFHWPKDLLCSCRYYDPKTGRWMVLGGTQGLGDSGATWGRIFCPRHYNEWIYPGSLVFGTITTATGTVVTVDVTGGVNLQTDGDGLAGRWVLITDEDGEQEQVAFISANTGGTFTVNYVYGGANSYALDPVPQEGWKFYLGMIEVRWGPKRFTIDEPSIQKHFLEMYTRIKDTDPEHPPFARLYRGVASGYERQVALTRSRYDGGVVTECWQAKKVPMVPAHQFGLSLVDRSYSGIEIQDLTLIFNPLEQHGNL